LTAEPDALGLPGPQPLPGGELFGLDPQARVVE
jgi:hypothetical protein